MLRSVPARATPTGVAAVLVLAALLAGCQGMPAGEGGASERSNTRAAELQTQLGINYMREGQIEHAFERLQRAVRLDPYHSPAHNGLAVLYDRTGDAANAEKHYARAVELNPADAAAQNNYANFLCRQGRIDDAEERFLKAARDPRYDSRHVAYANAGLCVLGAGKREQAERYLREALEIAPKLPVALLKMAELSLQAERYLPARAYLQRYQEVGEHTAQTLWMGVRVERALGDADAAASYALMLKSRFPDAPQTRALSETGSP